LFFFITTERLLVQNKLTSAFKGYIALKKYRKYRFLKTTAINKFTHFK